jgi:uncharacterized SAM-binding protein YcdF (DUF218 family)
MKRDTTSRLVSRRSKLLRAVVIITAIVVLGWSLRFMFLGALGRFLITADPPGNADALYVLGGAPTDRGTEAARLLSEDRSLVMICTGEPVPGPLKAIGLQMTEAALTRRAAMAAGADSSRITLLPYGTSTWEEALPILVHARAAHHDTIVILSSEFHLRRVRWVFRERFEGSGITVRFHAAAGQDYVAEHWWRSEQGLIMVNNEYVKLAYYLLNH